MSNSTWHQIKHSISNIFHKLLAAGLHHGQSEPTTIVFHHAPKDIQQLSEYQEWLGWWQLYYRSVSTPWIDSIQAHHPQINGTTYYTQCITLIWKVVLQVWKIQNQHLHPSSYKQEDHSLLEAEVDHIFQEAQQDHILQDMIVTIMPEQILSCPTQQVWKWVTNSKNHIWAHHTATQLWAKLRTQDIRQFFLCIIPPSLPMQMTRIYCTHHNRLYFTHVWILVTK